MCCSARIQCLRRRGPAAGLVFEDEGIEEGFDDFLFVGIELADGFELEAEVVARTPLGLIKQEIIGRDAERDGEALDGLALLITTYLGAAHAQGYATSTLESRRLHLQQFATWCVTRGLLIAQDLAPGVLERYQAWLAERPHSEGAVLSRATQANKLTAVRMLLAWATRTKRIVVNPTAELALPTLPKRLPRAVLSVPEVERVLAMSDVTTLLGLRDRAILEVLYSTCVLRMELVGLDVRDLAAERGALFVREGKGRKDRVVPIGARAVQWMYRYLDRVRTLLMRCALRASYASLPPAARENRDHARRKKTMTAT